MAKSDRHSELFTASEVARFCHVDLKTIHNWADRGEIRHFRTPGRHLRFRRGDVLEFLRKFGYPIPGELAGGKPRIHIIDSDEGHANEAEKALSKRFDVSVFQQPFAALVAIGAERPDLVVLNLQMQDFDGTSLVSQLKSNSATQHIPLVATGSDEGLRQRALDAGAEEFVPNPDISTLEQALERLVGGAEVEA